MNTPLDDQDSNLRYAEYVLGVLDLDMRKAVEQEVQSSAYAARMVNLWAQRLSPLAEEVIAQEPADYVWTRIRNSLGRDSSVAGRAPSPRRPLRENLPLWRGWALGASALAAVCLLLLIRPQHVAPSSNLSMTYMASTIVQNDGRTGWTVAMDLAHARIIVVPVAPQAMSKGHAPELWLIPPAQKPIAVGMIDSSAATTIPLNSALIAQLNPTAALAVSIEPTGGSPTGQPTGPVIAKGSIGAIGKNNEANNSVNLHSTAWAGRIRV